MDLTLVPLDDLIKEMEARCPSFVVAYTMLNNDKQMMYFHYGNGTWYKAVQLAAILNNDVLNNWNGELRTLQRLNEED